MSISTQPTTITTKGQVVIPKAIRDEFSLVPNTKVLFQVKNNTIVLQPVSTVDEMYGFLSERRGITTKQQQKAVIRQRVIKKFAHSKK